MAQSVCGLLNKANDVITLTAGGAPVSVQLGGTWAGTVLFVAGNDVANLLGVAATPWVGGSAVQSTTTSCGWLITSGANVVGVKSQIFTSGTVAVFITATSQN